MGIAQGRKPGGRVGKVEQPAQQDLRNDEQQNELDDLEWRRSQARHHKPEGHRHHGHGDAGEHDESHVALVGKADEGERYPQDNGRLYAGEEPEGQRVAAENLPGVHRCGEKARHGAAHALGDERHAAGDEREHEQEDADEHGAVEIEHPPVFVAVQVGGLHVLDRQVVAHVQGEIPGGKRLGNTVVEQALQLSIARREHRPFRCLRIGAHAV